jgi:hypothetical protein
MTKGNDSEDRVTETVTLSSSFQSLADIEEHTLAMASHAFIMSSMSGIGGNSG